jgi:hypothetical protein
MDRQRLINEDGLLIAAATMVAKDPQYAVRVVLPYTPESFTEAERAGELAGVDVVVARGARQATVHFVARHQDRRVNRQQLRSARRLSRQFELAPQSPAPRLVDLVAFQRASVALALNQAQDAEAQLIWGRLLQARTRAHLCGGIPTLMVNDVGGLVGLLRRRARTLGVTMRINPEACACG